MEKWGRRPGAAGPGAEMGLARDYATETYGSEIERVKFKWQPLSTSENTHNSNWSAPPPPLSPGWRGWQGQTQTQAKQKEEQQEAGSRGGVQN